MARASLRAVGNGEKGPVGVPKTLVKALEQPGELPLLLAMRAQIAATIDDGNIRGADLAALSRRLLEVTREIQSVRYRDDQSGPDDLADDKFDPEAI